MDRRGLFLSVTSLLLLLLVANGGVVQQEPEHTVALLGEDVILPCPFSFPGGEPSPFVVTWLKQDVEIPVYIWYDLYPPHTGEGYEGRVSLSGLASLNLTGAREADQGRYGCEVYFLALPPSTRKKLWVHLDVIDSSSETSPVGPISTSSLSATAENGTRKELRTSQTHAELSTAPAPTTADENGSTAVGIATAVPRRKNSTLYATSTEGYPEENLAVTRETGYKTMIPATPGPSTIATDRNGYFIPFIVVSALLFVLLISFCCILRQRYDCAEISKVKLIFSSDSKDPMLQNSAENVEQTEKKLEKKKKIENF